MLKRMMPRSETKFEEECDQEWDPTVPNGYEMFGVFSILAYLGIHAGKQHKQTAFHLYGFEHEWCIFHAEEILSHMSRIFKIIDQ